MSDSKNYEMTIYIKNMACLHCQEILKSELEKLGVEKAVISQGVVKINQEVSPFKKEQLNEALKRSGFELMDPGKVILVKKIRNIVDQFLHYSEEQLKTFLPGYISRKLKYDYEYLAELFSEVYNISIEKYFVISKIERVKELLVYYRLNLTEITYQLNYNSVAHLSNQFREVTGISPNNFQKIKYIRQTVEQDV
ncbi:MAG TPA: helix-turn-helix domain-containing protein [Bacteroidales bacterium]|nr:helix-turn-helix domain-containing protein [Bacteroidales bacterium]